jgi:hypothetical protein
LELALKQVEVAEGATAIARVTTEARLREVAVAEQSLRERTATPD